LHLQLAEEDERILHDVLVAAGGEALVQVGGDLAFESRVRAPFVATVSDSVGRGGLYLPARPPAIQQEILPYDGGEEVIY
jgi:hypothetical protein